MPRKKRDVNTEPLVKVLKKFRLRLVWLFKTAGAKLECRGSELDGGLTTVWRNGIPHGSPENIFDVAIIIRGVLEIPEHMLVTTVRMSSTSWANYTALLCLSGGRRRLQNLMKLHAEALLLYQYQVNLAEEEHQKHLVKMTADNERGHEMLWLARVDKYIETNFTDKGKPIPESWKLR